MRFLKHIYDFYINASIHVSLAVYALGYITLKELNIFYDEVVLNFMFYGSITGYNFVKYFGLAKFHHRSLANWLKLIQLFSLICFGLMFYYAVNLNFYAILVTIVMAIITFFYAIPFLPREFFLENKYKLRTIAGLKIYVISFVWAIVTVLLPVINNSHDVNNDVLVLAIQRFIFVFVLILPFDIRDMQYDSLKLSTIPQKIGITKAKYLGFGLLVVMFLLDFFKDDFHEKNTIILFCIALITALFLGFSNENRNKSFSAFWVEGIPILWLLLILLFN